MKKILLHYFITSLALLFLLSACGGKTSHGAEANISNVSYDGLEPALEIYQGFLDAAEREGIDTARLPVVKFAFADITGSSEPNSRTVGFCEWGTRTITLDRIWFKWASDLKREMLVFHELGHCALGREHTDICFEDHTTSGQCHGGFGSLMYPVVDRVTNNYKEFKDLYLEELFSKTSR